MADKSFGVKELNLLNASGTPTVTSPNNLNLNASTVAISTSCTIGQNLTVSANAGIASLNVTGVSTFVGISSFKNNLYITGNYLLEINDVLSFRGNNGGNSFISNAIDTTGGAPGNLYISNISGDIEIDASEHFSVKTNTDEQAILATQNGSVALYHDGGSKKFETTATGSVVTGILTATTFSGDPSNDSPHSLWDVVNNGSSSYRFTGPGQDGAEDNPDIFLVRGQRYVFKMNASGHPFQIRVSNGGSAYSDGVTNNGAQTGNVEINVQHDAPSRLYYQCTSHGGMVGNIYVIGGTRGILTQNTTLTGSSLTFDGIPTWATKITVNLLEASVSGGDQIYVRLRAGSSSISSDYSCVSGNFQGNLISSKTDAFNINNTGGTQLHSGSMVIEKIDSAGLKYVQSHMFLCTNNNSRYGGGNLERSSGAAIDGVEITVEGSNNFDNGVVTIYYE